MSLSRKAITVWSLAAAVAVVVTILISIQTTIAAPPVFVDGKLAAIRAPEKSEVVQDASKRAEFVPIASTILDQNPKLKEVLAGADSARAILDRLPEWAEAKPVNEVFEVKITEEQANTLMLDIPPRYTDQKLHDNITTKDHHIRIQVDGKFYIVTLTTAYKQ